MPPKQKTVGAYIEHEQKWRGRSKNVERVLRREWAAKTPTQRTALARKLIEVQNARTIVRAYESIARTARDVFREGEPYNENQTVIFRERLKAAIEAWKQLNAFQDSEKEAWSQLRSEQENQGASTRSLQFTDKCRNDATNRAAGWACSTEISAMMRQLDRPPLPISSPGRQRMPEKWLSSKTKTSRIRRKLISDSNAGRVGLRPRDDDGKTWFAQKQMVGGMAKVSLWLQVDSNNRIVDRLARKEQYYDPQTWFAPRKFDGNVKDESTRTPWEIVTHEAVSNIEGLDHVVRLYEAQSRRWIDNRARMHTMYLEWLPHGDLQDLIKDYKGRNVPIPEPMIWYCAEALAKCALAMEKGHVDHARREKVDGWEEIVHRDLKPTNVVLSHPATGAYPHYPRPAVLDFGFGIRTSKDDPTNPTWLTGCGTEGYRAPESYSWIDRDSGLPLDRNIQVLSPTDVYGVGVTLYCLVKRVRNSKQPLWLGNGEEDTTLHFADEDRQVYSHHLLEIIEACLSFRPSKRPTPSELIDLIEFYTREYQEYIREGEVNPHTKGMADVVNNASEEVRATNALSYGQDAYAIGMDRGQLPNEL